MHISTKGRYALRAMVDLARHRDKGPIALKEIAHRQSIPEKYLEQLFLSLRRGQLVTGFRGANGGYVLARDPTEIAVGEVIRCTEGPLEPVSCIIRGKPCGRSDCCAVREFWQELGAIIIKYFESTNLYELAQNSPCGEYLPEGS